MKATERVILIGVTMVLTCCIAWAQGKESAEGGGRGPEALEGSEEWSAEKWQEHLSASLNKDNWAAIDAVMSKIDKRGDPKGRTQAWDGLVSLRDWHGLSEHANSMLQAGNKLTGAWADWRREHDAFIADIKANGRSAVYWKSGLRIEMQALQDDIEFKTPKLKREKQELGEAHAIIDKADQMLAKEKATPAEIDKCLTELKLACRLVEANASSLQRAYDRISENYGIEPKMPKPLKTSVDSWSEIDGAYPGVRKEWRSHPTAWAKQAQKLWGEYMKVRKKYDEAFEPIIKRTVLDEFPRFKGKEYDDLADIPTKLRDAMTAKRVKSANRQMKEEEIRQALEEEQKISQKEWAWYKKYQQLTGPTRERELSMAVSRAAGGSEGLRELKLKSSRAKSEVEQAELQKQIDLHEAGKLPEQIAASKALEEFRLERKRLDAEYQKMWDSRKKRRAKLGLSVDWENK